MEIIARISFRAIPLEVHQKYYSDPMFTSNGRGARSPLYEGQSIQIAVIGESPVLQETLSDNQTWTAKLQEKLGKNEVHIDNFGIGYNKIDNIILILESFLAQDYNYDIILIETSLAPFTPPLKTSLVSYYSYRWFEENLMSCFTCVFIKNWFQRRWEQDQSSLAMFIKSKINTEISMAENLRENKSFYSGDYRQSEFVKKRLIQFNKVEHYSELQTKKLQARISRVNQLAKDLGAYLIWAPVRLGYHPEMKLTYYDLTITTATAPKWTVENPVYFNEESIFRIFEQRADETKRLVRNFDIEWIDYMQTVQNEMVREEGLMVDEFHASGTGSDIIATIVERKIQSLVKQGFIKNYSK